MWIQNLLILKTLKIHDATSHPKSIPHREPLTLKKHRKVNHRISLVYKNALSSSQVFK